MTARMLELGDGLRLPLEAVTQTFGILAVRGAGKSNLAAVLAEQLYAAQLPFVVVDPVGAWWGLRSSADGKLPGLAVAIFGGRHGDVPLERTGGALLADLVVDQRLSCVLDLSEFSEGDKIRFLVDFAERLYRRNQDPLHLILEEADDYAPQRPMHEQARLLRAWENIVRRGRARGLGITMITQRSAALNKNLLTQIETLCVLRTTSPQDRKAIAGWVEYHGQAAELLESLSGLADGESWVWSPSWLKKLQRIRVHRRTTFDSGATPKHRKGSRAPATLADVNLGAIRERMAATIERAKAEDPRELRRQVAELQRRLKEKATPAPVASKVEVREVPVLKDSQVRALEHLVEKLEKPALRAAEVAAVLSAAVRAIRDAIGAGCAPMLAEKRPQLPPRQPVAKIPQQASAPRTTPASDAAPRPRSQQRILAALVWLEGLGLARADKTQVALLADQSPTSGGYFNNLGVLRSGGLIDYPTPGIVALTDEGRSAAGSIDVPQTSEDLHRQLFQRLPGSQARILAELIRRYPESIAKGDLAAATGQSPTSGGYFNNLGRLRSLGLIDYPSPGAVVALPVLFLEGA